VPLIDEKDRVNRALNGRVSADQIVPYPPGIPVLVPGQLINAEIIQFLLGLLRAQRRTELHGIVYDGYLPCVRVLAPAEERGLKRLGR
jgi:arginine decarboxylase